MSQAAEKKIDVLLQILQRSTVKRLQEYKEEKYRSPFVAEVSIFTEAEVDKIKKELLKLANIK